MKKTLFFLILFSSLSCSKVLHLAEIRQEPYSMTTLSELEPDTAIANLIAPYKKKIELETAMVLGESAITMRKARPQSTLGNWMADLIHKKSEDHYDDAIDFALVNYGGIRISELPKGPVTRGKIYELMPFENMLVVLKVNGAIVQQLFDRMADYGGWPISKQVRYEIKAGKAQNITINGAAIDPTKIYKIALSDFVANGGDNCFFFKGQARDELDIKFRNAIMDFIQEETAAGKLLDAEMDFRVKLIAD